MEKIQRDFQKEFMDKLKVIPLHIRLKTCLFIWLSDPNTDKKDINAITSELERDCLEWIADGMPENNYKK